MTEALQPGSRVSVYEIVDRLGMGGMGVVFRARDTRLGRIVALKVLRSGDDPELLHRLDREARAASALNHPNIVHIYDVGVAASEAGAHYVAMEYVEGETLRRRLARGALPMPELLDLGAQLADGLAKAHRAGIVHRDVKPENLMVTGEGLLKILDFGLAKLAPPPLVDLETQETLTRHGTQAGMLLGTLEYMSPEQASGRPVDFRTDQFALGLVLGEMAVGQPLFRRDTPAQVLAAVIERDPEPLRQRRPDAPEALEALVIRCLQKEAGRRYARTDEIAAELAILAGRSRSTTRADTPQVPSNRVVTADIVAPPPLPVPTRAATAFYHVQKEPFSDRKDKIRTCDERELAELIRRGKLTGMELVRRDDEERWQPLFESSVFRREVPSVGDPRDAARWRVLRALGGHFTGFAITAFIMFATQGNFPFWLGIWGFILLLQALRATPAVWGLLRPSLPAGGPAPVPVLASPPPAPAAATVPTALSQEAVRVRALVERRGGSDAARLLAEVDGIVGVAAELALRQADLEEQTTEAERTRVAGAVTEAQKRLESASLAQDRRLYERQLDLLRKREDGIAKALRLLDRLRVRREMAEHQMKQLRLDLSRGAAVALDVPELSSRLRFIRHEVDAREEVEEIDAATD